MNKYAFLKTPIAVAVIVALACGLAGAQGLRENVDRLLGDPKLKGAAVGVRIVDASTGAVLYSYHADEVMSVASNAKIVTTAAALDMLGSKFELTTTLVARGSVSAGALNGDLVLVGRGDPSFSTHWVSDVMEPVRRLAREAAAGGINAVTGDIIADDTYFDREFWCESWPKDQWIQWYEAPVSAMAFNDNCVDVVVSAGAAEGAPAGLRFYPAVDYVNLANRVLTTTNRKKHGYAFYRGKYDNNVIAKGYFIKGGADVSDNFTVYDPALYLASALKKALSDAGINVAGSVRLMRREEAVSSSPSRVVAVNRITLAEVARYCNVNSQNLYAEMILKTLGREAAGHGSFQGGADGVADFLKKLRIQPGTYHVADGSGLSRETKYSAFIMTEVLRHMYRSSEIIAFKDSLPLAGQDGTMENRLTGDAYRGKVRAKTGYILGASALSGYALTANGKTLAFSIIMNNFKGSNRTVAKPIQDDICRAMIDSRP